MQSSNNDALQPQSKMPVKAFLEGESQSYPIYSANIVEAICYSFSATITFDVGARCERNDFIGKSWRLRIEDANGHSRIFLGECFAFRICPLETGSWRIECVLESMLSHLKRDKVDFRTETAVRIKDWVKGLLGRHGIGQESIEWRFDCRAARSHLVQALQSDYDYLLKILAQENIVMWPMTDKPCICLTNSPEQWSYGAQERLFLMEREELAESGGETVGVFEYAEHYCFAMTSEDTSNPELLYSGVPSMSFKSGNPFSYDGHALNDLFRARVATLSEQKKGYRYLTAKSNGLTISAGHWVNIVDVSKSTEHMCRIQYVHHRIDAYGKTLRYANQLLLQPGTGPWHAVAPPEVKLPMVMQAKIASSNTALTLTERGDEQVAFALPRLRFYATGQGGFSFPLEGESEVLLSFLYGEADLPVIVGAVPNGTMQNPVNDGNPLQSLLSTRGGNIFRWDDAPSQETVGFETSEAHRVRLENGRLSGIFLQSEGECRVAVGGDMSHRVGGSWHYTTQGDVTLSAMAEQEIHAGEIRLSSAGDIEARAEEGVLIEVGRDISISDEQFFMQVEEGIDIQVDAGDVQYEVSGAMTVETDKGIHFKGGEQIRIQGAGGRTLCLIEAGRIEIVAENMIACEGDEVLLQGTVAFS